MSSITRPFPEANAAMLVRMPTRIRGLIVMIVPKTLLNERFSLLATLRPSTANYSPTRH
jgi:hypothetical protein